MSNQRDNFEEKFKQEATVVLSELGFSYSLFTGEEQAL